MGTLLNGMSMRPKLTEPSGKEAELFRALPSGRIQCTACARRCKIGEGQVGFCGVRGVVGGRLYLLVYGRVMAGHIDPIEKKPVVHYRPGSKIFSIATSGCSWACHPAGTKVLLSDGKSKSVEDVIPGDMLWSYNIEGGMRIEPNVVTHTATLLDTLWEIEYGDNGQEPTLITGEHPVLTKDGWKPASKLRSGDEVLRVWHTQTHAWNKKHAEHRESGVFTCHNCGTKLVGYVEWDRHRGECYTRGMKHSEEQLERWSERMKGNNPMKNPDVVFRGVQTDRDHFLNGPNYGWHRNVPRLQSWLNEHPSKSQAGLYPLLDSLEFAYVMEYRVRGQ